MPGVSWQSRGLSPASPCAQLKLREELSAYHMCPSILQMSYLLPGPQALRHAFFTVPLAEQHGLSCAPDRSTAGWC